MAGPGASQRGRQFEIDRLSAEYASLAKAGRAPDPAAFLAAHPDYQAELAHYILTYHLALADLKEPDETPEPARSPAFARALAAIHADELARAAQAAAPAASAPALAGLAARAFDIGSDPEALAEKTGLTPTLIARLDAHAITAASLPAALFRRLAGALDVTIEAVQALLAGPTAASQSGAAFYYAGEAPATVQDDFLVAIEASPDLDSAAKAEWRAIVERGDAG